MRIYPPDSAMDKQKNLAKKELGECLSCWLWRHKETKGVDELRFWIVDLIKELGFIDTLRR